MRPGKKKSSKSLIHRFTINGRPASQTSVRCIIFTVFHFSTTPFCRFFTHNFYIYIHRHSSAINVLSMHQFFQISCIFFRQLLPFVKAALADRDKLMEIDGTVRSSESLSNRCHFVVKPLKSWRYFFNNDLRNELDFHRITAYSRQLFETKTKKHSANALFSKI